MEMSTTTAAYSPVIRNLKDEEKSSTPEAEDNNMEEYRKPVQNDSPYGTKSASLMMGTNAHWMAKDPQEKRALETDRKEETTRFMKNRIPDNQMIEDYDLMSSAKAYNLAGVSPRDAVFDFIETSTSPLSQAEEGTCAEGVFTLSPLQPRSVSTAMSPMVLQSDGEETQLMHRRSETTMRSNGSMDQMTSHPHLPHVYSDTMLDITFGRQKESIPMDENDETIVAASSLPQASPLSLLRKLSVSPDRKVPKEHRDRGKQADTTAQGSITSTASNEQSTLTNGKAKAVPAPKRLFPWKRKMKNPGNLSLDLKSVETQYIDCLKRDYSVPYGLELQMQEEQSDSSNGVVNCKASSNTIFYASSSTGHLSSLAALHHSGIESVSSTYNNEHGPQPLYYPSYHPHLHSHIGLCTQMNDDIYVGGMKAAENRSLLLANGITHIINCAHALVPNYFPHDFVYLSLDLRDHTRQDITKHFYNIIGFIEDVLSHNRTIGNKIYKKNQTVIGDSQLLKRCKIFIHCVKGISRSPAMFIAYMLYKHPGLSFEQALKQTKALRPIISLNGGFIFQIAEWENYRHQVYTSATLNHIEPSKESTELRISDIAMTDTNEKTMRSPTVLSPIFTRKPSLHAFRLECSKTNEYHLLCPEQYTSSLHDPTPSSSFPSLKTDVQFQRTFCSFLPLSSSLSISTRNPLFSTTSKSLTTSPSLQKLALSLFVSIGPLFNLKRSMFETQAISPEIENKCFLFILRRYPPQIISERDRQMLDSNRPTDVVFYLWHGIDVPETDILQAKAYMEYIATLEGKGLKDGNENLRIQLITHSRINSLSEWNEVISLLPTS